MFATPHLSALTLSLTALLTACGGGGSADVAQPDRQATMTLGTPPIARVPNSLQDVDVMTNRELEAPYVSKLDPDGPERDWAGASGMSYLVAHEVMDAKQVFHGRLYATQVDCTTSAKIPATTVHVEPGGVSYDKPTPYEVVTSAPTPGDVCFRTVRGQQVDGRTVAMTPVVVNLTRHMVSFPKALTTLVVDKTPIAWDAPFPTRPIYGNQTEGALLAYDAQWVLNDIVWQFGAMVPAVK